MRYAARRPEQVDELRAAGRDAVRLDLDDPTTFAHALVGVDRVYLLTGYTVAMLARSKTLIDAAVKAGVGHIVHQGVFANWDVTDIANPDLVRRWREDLGQNELDFSTLYADGVTGYTDYPTHDETQGLASSVN